MACRGPGCMESAPILALLISFQMLGFSAFARCLGNRVSPLESQVSFFDPHTLPLVEMAWGFVSCFPVNYLGGACRSQAVRLLEYDSSMQDFTKCCHGRCVEKVLVRYLLLHRGSATVRDYFYLGLHRVGRDHMGLSVVR